MLLLNHFLDLCLILFDEFGASISIECLIEIIRVPIFQIVFDTETLALDAQIVSSIRKLPGEHFEQQVLLINSIISDQTVDEGRVMLFAALVLI